MTLDDKIARAKDSSVNARTLMPSCTSYSPRLSTTRVQVFDLPGGGPTRSHLSSKPTE